MYIIFNFYTSLQSLNGTRNKNVGSLRSLLTHNLTTTVHTNIFVLTTSLSYSSMETNWVYLQRCG